MNVDLTKLTDEQIWQLFCLAVRLKNMSPNLPFNSVTIRQLKETATELIKEIEA